MIKWINKKKNQKGFTLVELVVVVAILAILAAIAVPRFGAYRATAAAEADKATAATIGTSVKLLIADGTIKTAVTDNTTTIESNTDLVKLISEDGTAGDAPKPQAVSGDFTYTADLNGNVKVFASGVQLYPDIDATYP